MERSTKQQRLEHNTEPDLEPHSDTPSGSHPGDSQQSNCFTDQGIENAGHLAAARSVNIIHHSHARDTERQDRERREEHRRALLDSLRFAQMDARSVSIKKAFGKTCRWFLNDPEYLQWSKQGGTDNSGGFLWIKGRPGAGKSTLMKLLLTQTRRVQPKNTLHFFFNARGEYLEKTTIGLYRSLLVQLLELHTGLQSILDRLPNDHHQWPVELLKDLIDEAIKGLGEAPVTCFIDALDECREQDVREMIGYLSELYNTSNQLRVCFASRHYPHITINQGRSIILENKEEHLQDIASYVDNALHVGTGKSVDDIKSDLQEKSSGVFMWVVLVVDILNREWAAGRTHGLRKRLHQIPGDLFTLFRDILTRDTKNTPGLLLCIQWVLFSKQPLTPKQLYFAIISGVEPENLAECHTEEITDDVIAKYILNNSKGLAESTKSKLPTIQFVHESVRDFLLKDNGLQAIWPDAKSDVQGQSHEALKQACLAYLNSEPVAHLNIPVPLHKAPKVEADKARDDADGKLPFLEYANHVVLYHADMAQSGRYGQTEFLDSFPLAQWVLHHNLFERHQIRRYTPAVSFRYVLAERNLGALIRAQSTTQSCLEVENERYGTPLFAALATKSTNAVQALIEVEQRTRDANPYLAKDPVQTSDYQRWCDAFSRNFSFSKQKGATSQLVEFGDEKLLKVLCTSTHFEVNSKDSANVNPELGHVMSPLTKAAEKGNIEMARLLIEQGADVNFGGSGGAPLRQAAIQGDMNMAILLLERGADINDFDQLGKSSLNVASAEGHADVVRLLIQWGANIYSSDKNGWTPLIRASTRGHADVVRLLIECGANIYGSDKNGWTPLIQASTGGYTDVVRLLIEFGANVNASDNNGWTPLIRASTGGHADVVKLLIERGADVNKQSNQHSNALEAASWRGDLVIMQMLIDNGADVNAEGGQYGSALHAAYYQKHDVAVRLLREKGAVLRNVNSEIIAHLKGQGAVSSDGDLATLGGITDSGYGTIPAEGSHCHDTRRSQQHDTKKALSIAESLETNDKDHAISEFVENLFGKLDFNTYSAQATEALLYALPKLLEAFADRIGYSYSRVWGSEFRYYIYKYQDVIVQRFRAKYHAYHAESSKVSGDISMTEKTEEEPTRLEIFPGLSDEMDWAEKMSLLNKVDKSYDIDPEEVRFRSADDNGMTEIEIYGDTGVPDKEDTKFSRYLGESFSNPMYKWLYMDLRKATALSQMTVHPESFRAKIENRLPSAYRVSPRRSTERSRISFYLDWTPLEFLKEQQYTERLDVAIERAITITGSPQEAQAMTCAEYLNQTWPLVGSKLLSMVKELITARIGDYVHGTLEDATKVSLCIQDGQVLVDIIGPDVSIAEVGEIFAWMAAALRSSPQETGIAYCLPVIEDYVGNDPCDASKVTPLRTKRFTINFSFHKKTDLHSETDGCCWFGLFQHPVLVEGYPVKRRSSTSPGLEIPLEILAELLETRSVTAFGSTLCIKGFAAIVAARERVGDAIIWHALYTNKGTRVSYLDNRVRPTSEDIRPGDLVRFRHIVGWCSKVTTYTGDPDNKYNIDWSGLGSTDGFLQNRRISRQALGLHGSRPAMGNKDIDPSSYTLRISDTAKHVYVVLYDVGTKRAWLADGASTMVHLLRMSLEVEKEDIDKDIFRLTPGILTETVRNSNLSPRNASVQFLRHNDNIREPLFQLESDMGESETFKDRVNKIWSLLDEIRDLYSTPQSAGGPRSKLEGFDFMDLASLGTDFKPCMSKITTKGMTWVDWMREAKAIVLFGDRFGDLFLPDASVAICPSWRKVPFDQEYLTVHESDIKPFLKKRNSFRQNKDRQLFEGVLWNSPFKDLQRCRTSGEEKCVEKCDMAQVLMDKTLAEGSSAEFEKLGQIGNEGAFIFGYSNKHPISWGDYGPPKEGRAKATEIEGGYLTVSSSESARGSETTGETRSVPSTTSAISRSGNSESIFSSTDRATKRGNSESVLRSTTKRQRVSQQFDQGAIASDSESGTGEMAFHDDSRRRMRHSDFEVAIICALPEEANACAALFDECLVASDRRHKNDKNNYSFGRIGKYSVVLAHMGYYGKLKASAVAHNLNRSFDNIELALVVGVCGAVPKPPRGNPIALGDVIVSQKLVQHDIGRSYVEGFERNKDHQGSTFFTSQLLESLLAKMETRLERENLETKMANYLPTTRLGPAPYQEDSPGVFHTECRHVNAPNTCGQSDCTGTNEQLNPPEQCDAKPTVHFGPIACGDTVLKNATVRDKMAQADKIIAFEMEGAGVWDCFDHCLVIKGACDFADYTKTKHLQPYAASTAAACMKVFLLDYWEKR